MSGLQAGRAAFARQVDQAVGDGRVPASARAAWLDAFGRDATAAARDLAGQAPGRFGAAAHARPSVERVMRAGGTASIPMGGDLERATTVRASGDQPGPTTNSAPTGPQGRVSGDESRRRDRVIAAAVADGRIARQSETGWRTRMDDSPAAVEAALANTPAGQLADLPRSLELASAAPRVA